MPMGNGTGPEGLGPGTGRGAGYCNGYDMPGAYSRLGRGLGRTGGRAGRGYGIGRGGFRSGFAGLGRFGGLRAGGYSSFSDQPVNTEKLLKEEADFHEKRLNDIRTQLNELEKDSE